MLRFLIWCILSIVSDLRSELNIARLLKTLIFSHFVLVPFSSKATKQQVFCTFYDIFFLRRDRSLKHTIYLLLLRLHPISGPTMTPTVKDFSLPWFRNKDQISRLTPGLPPPPPPGQQPPGAPRVWQPPPPPALRLQTLWLQPHCFAPLLCSSAWQPQTLA